MDLEGNDRLHFTSTSKLCMFWGFFGRKAPKPSLDETVSILLMLTDYV